MILPVEGKMDALLTAPELAKHLETTIYKVRRYTKLGILTPVSIHKKDGKTFLYDSRCAEIKLELLHNLRLDYPLAELGRIFKRVFGKRDVNLIKALHSLVDKEDVMRKFEKEIEGL